MPGEVEYFSILDNKAKTKTYWEGRMLATMEEAGGWESVGNVRFQPIDGSGGHLKQPPPQTQGHDEEDEEESDSLLTVAPPPEFLAAPPPQFDTSPGSEGQEQSEVVSKGNAPRPTKHYVYGTEELCPAPPLEQPQHVRGARIVETLAKRQPPLQENIIEAEIQAQQMKEEELRREGILRSKGASSPASHDSDEGFVERLNEDTGVVPLQGGGYTHALQGTDGDHVIYDTVSPPPQYFDSAEDSRSSSAPVSPTPSSGGSSVSTSTETKIAMEIRQLREREEELRQMRQRLAASSSEVLCDNDVTRSSSGEHLLLEDHLTSLTTTTDEGNYSECGDAASSEDKSSDGSNSRIMSPELHHGGHFEYGRRRVTVKPFEEEDEEDTAAPVYQRMQKESVIEREIRIAREREEAYRREKGLVNPSPKTSAPSASKPHRAAVSSPIPREDDRRDTQHRLATSRVQQEIQEISNKEKELRDAGHILTMSEDTVDAKVQRMSDLADAAQMESSKPRATSSRNFPATNKRSGSPLTPSSPVPCFTPSPISQPPMPRLTKSLSTNNLCTTTPTSGTTSLRAPRGLMEKFINSRGKMSGSAFLSPLPGSSSHITTTAKGVLVRPMRVEPKSTVVRREVESRLALSAMENGTAEQQQKSYRRTYCTAEEKIQSELKEMQSREEELKLLRARNFAQSQPNLAGLGDNYRDEVEDEVEDEDEDEDDRQDQHHYNHHEMNGLRAAISNPNLLEDEAEQTQIIHKKAVRRRSTLITQWESRIQAET